jgi:hypothetical protein
MFIGNEAYGGNDVADAAAGTTTRAQLVRGGAMDLSSCRVTISSSAFKQNKARDASVRVAAGALAVGEGSVVEVRGCLFDGNEAARGAQLTYGGAVRVDANGLIRVADTTFDGNAVTSFTEGFGGAVVSEGSVVFDGGVVFFANLVSGDVRAAGGAVAILFVTASLNASGQPGATFLGNTVRRCPGVRNKTNHVALSSRAQATLNRICCVDHCYCGTVPAPGH